MKTQGEIETEIRRLKVERKKLLESAMIEPTFVKLVASLKAIEIDNKVWVLEWVLEREWTRP